MAAFAREFYVESEDIVLNITQNIEGDVSCVVWDASLVLSAYLDTENKRNRNFLGGKNVIELGSGVGCVGLTAACLGANVIATDLPEVIPNLVNNITGNQDATESGGGKITAVELDWTLGNLSMPIPDFLLLADCIYYDKALQPLVDVIVSLSTSQTEVILCQEMRDSVKQQELWEKFIDKISNYFHVTCIPQEKQHPTFCSPDIVLLKFTKKYM